MRIPIYQVDAFTDHLFAGNPAAVCLLKEWLPTGTMQSIAAENNLSETAFFAAEGEGYLLRWFTPAVEIELCGHTTLASGHVVTRILEPTRKSVPFRTLKAGTLSVAREGERLVMDFPSWSAEPRQADPRVIAALGAQPVETLGHGHRLVAIYAHEDDVAGLKPDFAALRAVGGVSVVASAPGTDGVDFVSRYFAPNHGIDEDPVTGSTHCILTPYWARRLGKSPLRARQISARGGDLVCALKGDRITLAGNAKLYLEGTITI